MENVIIDDIKKIGLEYVDKIIKNKMTYTTPGSILYLLNGEIPSFQSINIKFGKFGEFICKELIKRSSLILLECGIQKIDNKNKDVDLLFLDEKNSVIYYRELKGNIELDTEKLPATINKCISISNTLKEKWGDYRIDFGILNWSIYNRKILTTKKSNIKSIEDGGVKVEHMEDFLFIIGLK